MCTNIYHTPLERMRGELLLDDLKSLIRKHWSRSILDIGAGHAPVTVLLLEKFPHLTATLVEPSATLLNRAADFRTKVSSVAGRVRKDVVYTPG